MQEGPQRDGFAKSYLDLMPWLLLAWILSLAATHALVPGALLHHGPVRPLVEGVA